MTSRRSAIAVGLGSAAIAFASSVSAQEAQEPGEPAKVELSIDLEAPDVRVEGKELRTSCGAPCVVQLPQATTR